MKWQKKHFMVSYIEKGVREKFYVSAYTIKDAKELSVFQGANPNCVKVAQELKYGW